MNIDVHLVMLTISALVFAVILWNWQKSADVNFDLRWLLVDSQTEKVSLMKVGQAVALVTSTWGFIALLSKDKLTEFYFIGYMASWAGANLANKFIETRREK
jgi:capsule polysaccharide export protein KpsC/LpsZ